jgi:hypothetical protein
MHVFFIARIDRHVIAATNLTGLILGDLGSLFFAYDVLGRPGGPLRWFLRTALPAFLGVILLFCIALVFVTPYGGGTALKELVNGDLGTVQSFTLLLYFTTATIAWHQFSYRVSRRCARYVNLFFRLFVPFLPRGLQRLRPLWYESLSYTLPGNSDNYRNYSQISQYISFEILQYFMHILS